MAIQVRIVDEDGIVQTILGFIEWEDSLALVQIATQLNMKCLNFLDPAGDTIFNEKQIYQIKEEIKTLQDTKKINPEVLNLINKATDEALKDVHLYLKFFGD